MKNKLMIAVTSILYFICISINADAQNEIQYDVFQHKGFSLEYPRWKVDKKTDKGRLLLKVSKGMTAVQVELFQGSINDIYDYHLEASKKSNNLISEDKTSYLIVHKAQVLWIKLFMYRKFFESGENIYVVTFVSTRGNLKRYKQMREYVFNSLRVKEIEEDNTTITFELNVDKEYPFGIYLTDSMGTYLKRIYKSRYPVKGAKLSCDAKKVVFYQAIGAKLKEGAGTEDPAILAHSEICLINVDGTGYKVLTDNEYADLQPNWTQDNQHIIFARDGGGRVGGYDLDIFMMDEQGGNVRNLTNTAGIVDADPHVYGGKIAFTRHSPGKINQSVWLMDEDGVNLRQLASAPKSGKSKVGLWFGDFDPNISFDLERVVFERLEDDNFKVFGNRVGRYSLWVVNIDGTGLKNISPKNVSDGLPQWLPDGKIIFLLIDDNLTDFQKLYIMNSDGTNRRRLIKTRPDTFLHGRPSAVVVEGGDDLIVFCGRFYG